MIIDQDIINDILLYVTVPVFTLFYWRGTWQICDHYFFSDDLEASAWCSLLVGYCGFGIFYVWQYLWVNSEYRRMPMFDLTRTPDTKDVQYIIVATLTRIETYIIGFLTVNCWRGIWLLQDVYLLTTNLVLSSWVSHIIGTIMLVFLLHLKSVYAPPVVYMRDKDFEPTLLSLLSKGNVGSPCKVKADGNQEITIFKEESV